ncbi:minor tail protein [Gordonia phage Pleakley]|uniref:Minor tail protein n=1 Tax=Gordonia phage Pleakley TaxID=2283246 RepID=A0A345M6G9_9CAUD|nr:minor tail protein [Gordonia phage Pleakley]AXH49777.1 minor tail protein [Gordonia phage Fury]AXH66090.1 minor tail protein [Gordonia phage Pleakley]
MTTPVTTVKEAIVKLILRWDGDAMDYESERRAIIEVTNGVGELLLPRGRQGDKGLDGEPGPKLAPDLIVNYADDGVAHANLPSGLADGDRGYVVLNDTTKTAFFWNGEDWTVVHDVVGLQGEMGPSVGFTIGTVTTSPSGGSAQVSIDPSSTATNKVLNFVLPRGGQGAVGVGQKGEPGDALSGAGDVDMGEDGPVDGQVLVYDTTIGKWRPMSFASGPVGPYGLGPNDFTAINDNNWSQDYKTVAQIQIPEQGFAWHPRVFAQCDVRLTGIQARVDLEARLGSPTGPVVGRGPGNTVTTLLDNYYPRDLSPAFEGGPMTPESTSYSVPKGTVGNIYLTLRRIDTLATFGVSTRKDRASMVVYCDPIPGSET